MRHLATCVANQKQPLVSQAHMCPSVSPGSGAQRPQRMDSIATPAIISARCETGVQARAVPECFATVNRMIRAEEENKPSGDDPTSLSRITSRVVRGE
jgi:hypothetical protein